MIWSIHNGGEFFGSYPNPDTLNTWSEAFLYYEFDKSEYSSCLTTLLIFRAIFQLEASWTIYFIRFLGIVKSLYKQDLLCSSSQGQIETKQVLNFARESCNI